MKCCPRFREATCQLSNYLQNSRACRAAQSWDRVLRSRGGPATHFLKDSLRKRFAFFYVALTFALRSDSAAARSSLERMPSKLLLYQPEAVWAASGLASSEYLVTSPVISPPDIMFTNTAFLPTRCAALLNLDKAGDMPFVFMTDLMLLSPLISLWR